MVNKQPAITPMYKVFKGQEIRQCIPFVAALRLQEFRKYPYLYAGTLEQENEYLQHVAQCKDSIIVVAYHDDIPLGFISGTHLPAIEAHTAEIIELFHKNNLDPYTFFYVGELIVLPEYRGNKTAVPVHTLLTRVLAEHIKKMHYSNVCFITAERGIEHPLRPEKYRSIEALCLRHKFNKTNIKIKGCWDTVQSDGTIAKRENELVFWIKTQKK